MRRAPTSDASLAGTMIAGLARFALRIQFNASHAPGFTADCTRVQLLRSTAPRAFH
jgi:hypothetical protein